MNTCAWGVRKTSIFLFIAILNLDELKFLQKDTKYVIQSMNYAAIEELGMLMFNYSIDNATGSTILTARIDTKEDFLRILVRKSQSEN